MPRFDDEQQQDTLLGVDGGSGRRRCEGHKTKLLLGGGIVVLATVATIIGVAVNNGGKRDGTSKSFACTPDRTCEATASGTFSEATCGGTCNAEPIARPAWKCGADGACTEERDGDGEFTSGETCASKCAKPNRLYVCKVQPPGNQTSCETTDVEGNATFSKYGCDGTCTLPVPDLFTCDGGNCVQTYTPGLHTFEDPQCEQSCSGAVKTYSCNHDNQCAEQANGSFTSRHCDGVCTNHTPTAQKFRCGAGANVHKCVRDDEEGTFLDPDCGEQCGTVDKTLYHCNAKGKCKPKRNCAGPGCFTSSNCDGKCTAT